ncbi:MAG: MFS transporter, partial [Pseudonocardiaceae bacterium]
ALVAAGRLVPSRQRSGQPVVSQIDIVGALLLGTGVLCLLLPLVQAESGGLRRLWWLFVLAPALLALFLSWEHRMVRRDRAPLLDTRLLSATPGYPAGAMLGMLYFIGFSGIWLVFAVYFQRGLGYTPLQSGLAATAVVLDALPPAKAVWPAAATLLVAGIGSGAVISPNVALTLECVPPRMGGAAAGALQTGQRIGSAIGTALLAAVFYRVVGQHGHYQTAIAVALLTGTGFVCLALLVAGLELRMRRRRVLPAALDEANVVQADVHRT